MAGSHAARKWTRRALRLATAARTRPRRHHKVWIDVGAHHGETTLPFAAARPSLLVYAFEPNPAAAAHIMGRLRNYVVMPFGVAEEDGYSTLNLTSYEQSSSLMSLDESAVRQWVGGAGLEVVSTIRVPTIRLDTFLDRFGIAHVDYLKVDAQGGDLAVLRSAGSRLADVDRVEREVATVENRPYVGSPDRAEVVDYLTATGFELVSTASQSFGQEENLSFARRA